MDISTATTAEAKQFISECIQLANTTKRHPARLADTALNLLKTDFPNALNAKANPKKTIGCKIQKPKHGNGMPKHLRSVQVYTH